MIQHLPIGRIAGWNIFDSRFDILNKFDDDDADDLQGGEGSDWLFYDPERDTADSTS